MDIAFSPPPTLSVVLPFFNEAGHLEQVLRAVNDALLPLNLPFELILVDDGSTDATWTQLQVLCRRDPRLRAFRLSRNFGKETALSAGLAQTRGAAVITMDGDLQHPPTLIAAMVARWPPGDVDILAAVKRTPNRDGALKQPAARLFYQTLRRLTGMHLDGASDFKLLDRRVVDVAGCLVGEHTILFPPDVPLSLAATMWPALHHRTWQASAPISSLLLQDDQLHLGAVPRAQTTALPPIPRDTHAW